MAEFRLDFIANTERLTQGLQNGLEALHDIGQEAVNAGRQVSQSLDGKSTQQLQRSLRDSFVQLGKMEVELRRIKAALKAATDPKDISRLNDELQSTTNSLIQFDQQTDNLNTSQKSLRAQLRENREILAAMEEQGLDTTKSFEELQIATGRLQDQINDANERIRFFASDTRGLDGAIALSKAAAAGFAVAEGTAALFGAENENVQKALLKVNAAMAILNGLQEIQAAIQKSSAARLAIENTLRKVRIFIMGEEAVAMNTLTAAEKAATIGARVLRAALLATGVGAVLFLISTLAEAAASMSKFGDATKSTTDLIKEQDEALQDLTDSIQFNTDKQIADAKRLGANNETVRAIQKKGFEDQIKAQEKDRDDKLAIIEELQSKTVDILKNGTNDEIKAFKERFQEAQDAYKGSLDNLISLRRDYNLFVINSQTDSNAEVADANKKFDEDQEKRAEENRKKAEERARIELQRTKAMLARQIQINTFIRETAKKANDELFKVHVIDEEKILDDRLSFLTDLEEIKKIELDLEFETGDKSLKEARRIAKEKLQVEIDFAQQRLELLREAGASVVDISAIELAIKKAQNQIAELEKDPKENPLLKALGLGDVTDEQLQTIKDNLGRVRDSIKSIFDDLLQGALDANGQIISNLDEQISKVQDNIKKQQDLQREGQANNLEAERANLDKLQQERLSALEKQKKLQREKLNIDAAAQVSSLITASANIFKAYSELPIVGQILSIAAITSMLAAFAVSQVQARKAVNTQTFEKGGQVKGNRHSQGGEKYWSADGNLVEIEEGEYVVRRNQAKKYMAFLEAINTDNLQPANLQRLLNGTGISLDNEKIERYKGLQQGWKDSEAVRQANLVVIPDKGVDKLREDFNAFRGEMKAKPNITYSGDYRIEQRGNRTIKTKIK